MSSKPKKDTWAEGTVFARHIDKEGAITYQEHRCWNMPEFCRKQAIAAAQVGGESKFEQVDEATYLRWKQLQRRHR